MSERKESRKIQPLLDELYALLEEEVHLELHRVESFVQKIGLEAGSVVLELLEEGSSLTEKMLSIIVRQALPFIDDQYYIPSLLLVLGHNNASSKVRFEVIQKLGWSASKAKRAIPMLLEIMEKDEDLRGIAALALAEIGLEKYEVILPSLFETLKNGKTHIMRMNAARFLANFESKVKKDVLLALIKAMENDPDFRVRQRIVYFLGEIGGGEVIAALEKVKEKDKHPLVRSMATRLVDNLK